VQGRLGDGRGNQPCDSGGTQNKKQPFPMNSSSFRFYIIFVFFTSLSYMKTSDFQA
jgi:hypothetical protein